MKTAIKILSLALSLILTLSLFVACDRDRREDPTATTEATTMDISSEALDYYPLPDGTYGVKAGKALYLETIIIPDTYNGKPVTQILENAFEFAKNLKEIIIPDSVTSIDYCAFYHCYALTSITIPNSVTTIDLDAFYACSALTDIYFTGSEDEWKAISKSKAEIPDSATIHYNYTAD